MNRTEQIAKDFIAIAEDYIEKSFGKIAKHHNVTRERVRQIIRKACRDARAE